MPADIWSQAVYDSITNDDDIVEAIGTYEGEPAVFTSYPIPGDAPDLFILSVGNQVSEDIGTKTSWAWRVQRAVYVYGKNTGSEAAVQAVAEMLKQLFHRDAAALSIEGHSVYIAGVSGPIAAPTDEDMSGRQLILTLQAEEDRT